MARFIILCAIFAICLCALVAEVLCNNLDPYAVLGVHRRASQKEIKRTYKKLAREWHPDKNREENAQEKFIQISQAYEILGDEEKRAQYDTYGSVDNKAQQHGGQQGGYQTFNFGGFNFKFQNQNSGSSYRQSHRVTLAKYDDVIAPQSYHKPWLILVVANWCYNCMRVEEVWNDLLSDFEELGIGMGIVNADYDNNLARKLGVYRWPSIIAIVDEQVHSYGDNHISKDNLKYFLQRALPDDLITAVTDRNIDDFVSTWRYDNKPRALLFSRRSGPSLLYRLAALQFRQNLKLGFTRLGGRDSTELVWRYAVNEREPTLLIFKENVDNYAAKFEGLSLQGGNLGDTLSSQKYLNVPRLSSQGVYEDLCKETPLFKTKSICIVLLTKNHISHMDYQESFRQVCMESTWPEDARFVYLYRENQASFVSALGTDDMLPIHRLPVAIIWRRNEQKVKYGWLPGGWAGDNISDNKKRLKKHLQDLITKMNLLPKQVELPKLNDENAPHWLLQFLKGMFQKTLSYIYSFKDSILSGNVNEATVAVGVIFIYVLAFFLAFASILGSKGKDPWEEKRNRRRGDSWDNMDDSSPAHRERNLPNEPVNRRTASDPSKYRHIELTPLDPGNYSRQIIDSRQTGMMLLLLVDSKHRTKIIERFKQEAYTHISSQCHQFQKLGYINIDHYPKWFKSLLANSTHPEKNNISTNTIGTVLALRPAKRYFSIYHPQYVTVTSSSMGQRQLDPGFVGMDTSSDDDSDDEGAARELRRADSLCGLRMWLDRLVDGSLARINVSHWPADMQH